MPRFEKTRIEVYIPDLPVPDYHNLLERLQREFTYAFGGSTVVHGLSGTYLSQSGLVVEDRMNLLYTDATLNFTTETDLIDEYADEVRDVAFSFLEEEVVLVTTQRICHSGAEE